MNWTAIGGRIRSQREYMGYTREQLAEMLDVTPKFCSDIELGVKGMSVPTLCKISETLHLTTDYILFGRECNDGHEPIFRILETCSSDEQRYAEELLKIFLSALAAQKGL